MTLVLPAIIPHTKDQLEEEIKKVAGFAQLVQVDISDGVFVPVKSWPYNGRDAEYFQQLTHEEVGWPRWEEVDVELHLMVKNPEEILNDWIKTGIVAVVAHIEATENFQKIIDICREHTVAVGIAIKPSTDVARLKPYISQVDFIQCMGNDMLGKHGVELDLRAVVQIQKLHELYPERIIAIDIGVNDDTAEKLVSAGATKLVSTTAIYNNDNPEEEYLRLESIS